MERKSNSTEGYVNFPIESNEWVSTEEGGMSVYLVADGADNRLCFGQDVRMIQKESLVGDWPEYDPPKEETVRLAERKIDQYIRALMDVGYTGPRLRRQVWSGELGPGREFFMYRARERLRDMHYFPDLEWADGNISADLVSPSYGAVIEMGTTGWSGHNEDGRYWRATNDDLEEFGRAIFDVLDFRFPNATLRLLTFLDT